MWQTTETVCAGLRASHLLDESFHVAQIVFECTASSGRQFVFSFRQPPFKIFRAGDVARLFEFARVNAEVTVSGIHQVLQIAERQRLVRGERADDSETQTLVDQTIEIWRGALLFRTYRASIHA